MVLLQALGIDPTLFIQLGIFLALFVLTHLIVSKPFFTAHLERHQRTYGNQETAERTIAEAAELHREYEIVAQNLNKEFRSVYDTTKAEAMREFDAAVNAARTDSKVFLETTRANLHLQLSKAQGEMNLAATQVSQSIVKKLLN